MSDALMLERLAARDAGTLPEGTSVTPSGDEVSSRLAELRQLARVAKTWKSRAIALAVAEHLPEGGRSSAR